MKAMTDTRREKAFREALDEFMGAHGATYEITADDGVLYGDLTPVVCVTLKVEDAEDLTFNL